MLLIILLAGAGCSKNADGPYYTATHSTTFNGNIYAYLQQQPAGHFDSLLLVLDRVPSIKDSLQHQNDISFFAIDNSSFATALKGLNQVRALQNKPSLSLSTIDQKHLDTLLSRYVLTKAVNIDSLTQYFEGLNFPSLHYGYTMKVIYNKKSAGGYVQGGPLELSFVDIKNSIFSRFWVTTFTVVSGTNATNGIVFDLSPGHVFGFGEFLSRLLNT
ncbi:hypothetical protein LL912_23575 [Niabella sp. CC-SYL272]|uniref:hypothetical protein n=1 Tax=Niabella agricola TaxID=2891571 RepID=UPI001F177322|nr:hypothetical protein [Niabella agricola]MCF3111788.1 hypothetical protein [Niabella agricola]